jgi:L-lactate dehydrogenase complex protein LldF
LELARKRAGYIRHKGINGLEKYLIEFEANLERNGGKVIWAQDSSEAVKQIIGILKKSGAKYVTKSSSLIAEEIGLKEELGKENIKYVEVNPGELILSEFEEEPRHLSSVLIHKSLDEITARLSQKHKLPVKAGAIEVHNLIRNLCREDFENSTVSITGANYLIADTGSVCISENTADGVLCSAIPKIQIVIAGIDKIIPSIMNLDVLLPLYSTYSSGEKINAFNTILSGPRQDNETDGPSEMYVVILDNGRSNILEQKLQRRALSCIECGACQNVCPVYRKIGGETYNTLYTGPIGSIITPWMKGIEEYIHLSFASTLCGKCTEICPVNINLHDQLLYNRSDAIRMNTHSFGEKLTMIGWHRALKSRKLMDWGSSKWKNITLRYVYGGKWGKDRVLPQLSDKSFKTLWEERREGTK